MDVGREEGREKKYRGEGQGGCGEGDFRLHADGEGSANKYVSQTLKGSSRAHFGGLSYASVARLDLRLSREASGRTRLVCIVLISAFCHSIVENSHIKALSHAIPHHSEPANHHRCTSRTPAITHQQVSPCLPLPSPHLIYSQN